MEFHSDIKFDNEEQEKNAYRKNLIDVNLPQKLREKEDIKINSLYQVARKKMEEETKKKLKNENKELKKKLEEKENTINKLKKKILELKNIIKDFQEIKDLKNEIKELKNLLKEGKNEGFERMDELIKLIRGPNEYELILAPKKKIIEQSQNKIIDAQEKLIEKLQGNEGGHENDEEIERLKEIIEAQNEQIKNAKMIIEVYNHNNLCGVKDFFQQEGKQSTANKIDNLLCQANNPKKDDDEEDEKDDFNERPEIEPTCNSTLRGRTFK